MASLALATVRGICIRMHGLGQDMSGVVRGYLVLWTPCPSQSAPDAQADRRLRTSVSLPRHILQSQMFSCQNMSSVKT